MSHVANWSQEKFSFSGTAAALGALTDIQRYTDISFQVTGLTVETITIQLSYDGGQTWSTTNLAVIPITGAAAVTTIPAVAAEYYARIPACTQLRFTKSATTDPAVIKGCLRWA
jgi:hypothetical protein